jgi:hypothetical protein
MPVHIAITTIADLAEAATIAPGTTIFTAALPADTHIAGPAHAPPAPLAGLAAAAPAPAAPSPAPVGPTCQVVTPVFTAQRASTCLAQAAIIALQVGIRAALSPPGAILAPAELTPTKAVRGAPLAPRGRPAALAPLGVMP